MYNYELDNWVVKKLSEPFPIDRVKWLPAFGFKKGAKATPVLGYVDARTIVERLDEVVGSGRWSDSYLPVTVTTNERISTKDVSFKTLTLEQQNSGFPTSYGGIECTLVVLGVKKSDVGSPSFSDQLKGAYSDALKRAGVKFGIGEYFYRLGTQFAKFDDYNKLVEAPKLPDWALPRDFSQKADSALLSLLEKIKTSDLDASTRLRAEKMFSNVQVMGSYNTDAPLVDKRYVFEHIQELLTENKGEN